MGLWKTLKNLIKNGEKGQSEILRFFTFIIIALLIITFIIPPLFDLFGPSLNTTSAIGLLESEGYWVLAQGACYPGDFIPCETGTQSLGSDAQRWKDLWLAAPTIYLGNVTISNSGSQIDIDGQLVMHDAGKVWMELQPDLDYATLIAQGRPTQVYRGVSSGMSLPVWNNNYEELYASLDIPREWDGETNPLVHIHCYVPEANIGEWASPISYNDLGGWEDETEAYDHILITTAYNDIPTTSWSNFLELVASPGDYYGVRFYTGTKLGDVNEVDLDVYYNGQWHDVYQGDYKAGKWTEKSLGGVYNVEKSRIRYYNSGIYVSAYALLGEFEFAITNGTFGNYKLELAWSFYNAGNNDEVPLVYNSVYSEIFALSGENKSYVSDFVIDYDIGGVGNEMSVCDQLDIRLRRISTSNDLVSEVVITHLGVQFLRDKLGTITPDGS